MLRHKGVYGEMDAVDRSKEELAVLRRFPEAVRTEFRRDGDMGALVAAVKGNRFVEVSAAVGAGKSTRVPLLLSKAMGCLVIHTIPFDIAVQHLNAYLSGTESGDKIVYMNDLASDMPTHGVVLMSNPFLFARLAYDNLRGVENAVLYLDESHESDAWTATLRQLAPAITSFRSVVKASATGSPGQQMTPDLPSRRDIRMYKNADVTTWSARDRGMPWSADSINTNAMMCIDRKTTREFLSEQYRESGFNVRDCCNQDYAYFRETMRMLKDSREGIVIVMVDYKFRSSFSIPGTPLFIDSCEVGVPSVEHNAPMMQYRDAFDFEVQQFLGRGGRLPNTPVVLWRSEAPSPKRMCDLESLECDASNLLYRMVGFRPPLDQVEYPYFKGNVPIDIGAAMASDHPLRLCPDDARVPWVNGHLALKEEKQLAAYEYEVAMRTRAKPVSCHTVVDAGRRSVTPPPPVPGAYRRTRVDVDGLDKYNSSRDSSPATVFTLDTEIYDHCSAINAAAVKPKRIAQRVLDARAAEAALAERKLAEEKLSGEMTPLTSTMVSVPDFPVLASEAQSSREAVVKRDFERSATVHGKGKDKFIPVSDGIRPFYSVLQESERHGPDLHTGAYYHYHGMESASRERTSFVQGISSVLAFCDQPDAKRHAKGLIENDKMFAVLSLVEASNESTAVAMGIQRLVREVSGRPPEQWRAVMDYGAMMDVVDWMATQCTEQQAKVRLYHSLIPWFAKYELEEMPPPLELEQRVMLGVMEKFERAAVKKDPDKAIEYMARLNSRVISINQGGSSYHRRNYLNG